MFGSNVDVVVVAAVNSGVVSEAAVPGTGSEGWRYRRDAIIRRRLASHAGDKDKEKNRRGE